MRNRSLRTAAILVATTLFFAVFSFAQSGSNDNDLKAELEGLHNRWIVAYNKGDGATMDRMEAPNLILVNAGKTGDGGIWQKPGPRAGKLKPSGRPIPTLSDTKVRQFGDAAILTGLLTTKGDPGRTIIKSTTVVWVRQSGQWLIASGQWSDVAPRQK